SVLIVIAFSFVLPSVYAQGGKAAPLRIQFQRGRDSATVNGKLRGDQQAEYALGAKKGQKLTIHLYATPQSSITVKVRDPEGSDLELKPDSKQQWSAVLPNDGDYDIWVIRSSGKPGTSRYKLTITIR
ncbi:MAG: hypothetical protein ACREAB_11075, partial [Blastocatellia bacterium]